MTRALTEETRAPETNGTPPEGEPSQPEPHAFPEPFLREARALIQAAREYETQFVRLLRGFCLGRGLDPDHDNIEPNIEAGTYRVLPPPPSE
jgi:hypothetical protein